jgi:hypothetical protein
LLFSGTECPTEEPCDNFDIEATENGGYKTALRVPRLVIIFSKLILYFKQFSDIKIVVFYFVFNLFLTGFISLT